MEQEAPKGGPNGWFEKHVMEELADIKAAMAELRAAPKPGEGMMCHIMRTDIRELKGAAGKMGYWIGFVGGLAAILGALGGYFGAVSGGQGP